jgi:hypothetical protein
MTESGRKGKGVMSFRVHAAQRNGARNPAQSFAEGGFIDFVAFGETLRWIPDSIPLRCMLPG